MKEWLRDAVFYQIYPQSFNDTNADGIGDIQGIIQKLDYIKNTGFNAIWINPCYTSPFTDAGYDVEDYYTIAPRYGTNEDIKNLFAQAHAKGIRVILDLVPGHTSITCKWFQESLKPEKNEYSGRYIWTDYVWKGCDGYSGISGSMRGLSDRNGSFGVNYYSTQPALNYGFAKITESWQQSVDSEDAVSTCNAIIDIIRHWLSLGCDGFRVDMAFSLVKDDDDHLETIKLWKRIFNVIRPEFPDAVFVSEWGQPDESLIAGFDMDFLLPFGDSHYMDLFRTDNPYFSKMPDGDALPFFTKYIENVNITKGKGLMCIPSGNHDIPRISYKLDDEEMKLAYAFLMSMPGAPFIYYGDEIGMKYVEGLKSVEGAYNRTGSRTPMQWDNSLNNGFSSSSRDKLYIPIDSDADKPTVEKQISDKSSIYNELKKLISVRHLYKALQADAEFELVHLEKSASPLVYKRGGKILVAINVSDKAAKCEIKEKLGNVIYELGGSAVLTNDVLSIPACSASFIEII